MTRYTFAPNVWQAGFNITRAELKDSECRERERAEKIAFLVSLENVCACDDGGSYPQSKKSKSSSSSEAPINDINAMPVEYIPPLPPNNGAVSSNACDQSRTDFGYKRMYRFALLPSAESSSVL